MIDLSKGCIDPRPVYLSCEHSGKNYGLMVSCHRRFKVMCPECSKRWKRGKIKQFWDAIEAMRHPKFLTLTLQRKRSMDENLDRIWDMRRKLFWILRHDYGYKIDGWLGVIELPVHAHLVIDCKQFIPRELISSIWHTLTGDSFIIKIKKVFRIGKMVSYLSKYLGKSLDTPIEAEYLKGFHVVQSWNIPKLEKQPFKCPVCGEVHPVLIITDEEYYHDPDRQFDE